MQDIYRYIYIYIYIYRVYNVYIHEQEGLQFNAVVARYMPNYMSCLPISKESTIHKPIDFDAHFYREAELTKQIDAQKIEMKLQCERYEKKIKVRFQN